MEEEWICAICLEGNTENCHVLVPCNHRFHAACLIESLRRSGPMCPLCRGLHDDHIAHQDNNLQENNIQLDIYEIDVEPNNDAEPDNVAEPNNDAEPDNAAEPDNVVEPDNAAEPDNVAEENIINNIYQNMVLNDVVIQRLGNHCINLFQNDVDRPELRDNLIRIYVMNNFNYFHNNRIREAIFNFIRNNCNFKKNALTFV